MFESVTLSYAPPAKRVWATAMGFTGQALLIGCAMLAPMLSPQTLGRAFLVTGLVAPGAPPPPPPVGTHVVPTHTAAPAPTQTHVLTEPTWAPPVAAIIIDDAPEAAPDSGPGVVGGISTGLPVSRHGSMIGDILASASRVPVATPATEAPREAAKAAPAPVTPPRISVVKLATPIRRVDPVYPSLAIRAHVAGVVELLGVLGTDGRIHELRVLRGHPLLIGAALEAVRQWVYEPMFLNGQAVEVAAPITVNFVLNQ